MTHFYHLSGLMPVIIAFAIGYLVGRPSSSGRSCCCHCKDPAVKS
jgi:hypothetical protein